MEKKGLLVVCAVVGVLSLITVILGIIAAASAAQSFVGKKNGVLSCSYQAGPAVGCGVVAGLLALTTQIVATAATGCCGCCRTWGIPSKSKRIVAVVLSTVSWLLAIILVIMFFMGALLSSVRDLPPDDDGKCIPEGTGVFVGATIMFIIAVVFQIISYILLQTTAEKPLTQEQGIAMAQPVQPKAPLNADQQVAAGDDPPPSAPPVTSKVGVVDPTPVTTESSKASAIGDPTSQV